MIQNIFEKEDRLKDMVVKLLEERNFSGFDMLNSLFTEVKEELQNQQENSS